MGGSFFTKIITGIFKNISKVFKNPFADFGISWLRLKKLKHQGYNKPGLINLKSISVKYLHPPELLHSVKEIFIDEVYKIKLHSESPYIIDCGANIGLSIINLKLQFPESNILAFEPDSANFELLKENTAAFKNVQLLNCAVWNENTFLEFDMTGTQGSSVDTISKKITKSKIEAVRLKDYLNKQVDFLKIDIEGAEYEILKDCKDCLSNVKNLFLEYHGTFSNQNELTELFVILASAGFKYYIKEAANVHPHPFSLQNANKFDVQLNIFAFK
jgi:FkbM family methyltransferase